jgi:ankyrin repeat protein
MWKVMMKQNETLLKHYQGAHNLAVEGKTKCLESLIESGTDINEYDESGNTFLHLACAANKRICYETLVQKGASLSIKNAEGQYALDFLDAAEAEKLRSMAPREEATAACKLTLSSPS